jgi:hypothetical protein
VGMVIVAILMLVTPVPEATESKITEKLSEIDKNNLTPKSQKEPFN